MPGARKGGRDLQQGIITATTDLKYACFKREKTQKRERRLARESKTKCRRKKEKEKEKAQTRQHGAALFQSVFVVSRLFLVPRSANKKKEQRKKRETQPRTTSLI